MEESVKNPPVENTASDESKPIPFSEIVVTDDDGGVLALITGEEIVEHTGYHVIAH